MQERSLSSHLVAGDIISPTTSEGVRELTQRVACPVPIVFQNSTLSLSLIHAALILTFLCYCFLPYPSFESLLFAVGDVGGSKTYALAELWGCCPWTGIKSVLRTYVAHDSERTFFLGVSPLTRAQTHGHTTFIDRQSVSQSVRLDDACSRPPPPKCRQRQRILQDSKVSKYLKLGMEDDPRCERKGK